VLVTLDLVNLHFIHGGIGIIHHIVDRPGKGKDVLPVERCDEGLVQFFNQDPS